MVPLSFQRRNSGGFQDDGWVEYLAALVGSDVERGDVFVLQYVSGKSGFVLIVEIHPNGTALTPASREKDQ